MKRERCKILLFVSDTVTELSEKSPNAFNVVGENSVYEFREEVLTVNLSLGRIKIVIGHFRS